jgi:hypothetical protein
LRSGHSGAHRREPEGALERLLEGQHQLRRWPPLAGERVVDAAMPQVQAETFPHPLAVTALDVRTDTEQDHRFPCLQERSDRRHPVRIVHDVERPATVVAIAERRYVHVARLEARA